MFVLRDTAALTCRQKTIHLIMGLLGLFSCAMMNFDIRAVYGARAWRHAGCRAERGLRSRGGMWARLLGLSGCAMMNLTSTSGWRSRMKASQVPRTAARSLADLAVQQLLVTPIRKRTSALLPLAASGLPPCARNGDLRK